MRENWYKKSSAEVIEILGSSGEGLSREEAERRILQYGPNTLPERKPPGLFSIFLRQFQSPLIYILMAAALLVVIMGEYVDGIVIGVVLLFNSIIGTIQEGRSQNTLRSLKNLTETSAAVLRDGEEVIISDAKLVPGDIVILREGVKVPADLRIISCHALRADEASITGESEPVYKISGPIGKNTETMPFSDWKNCLFKGTNIVSGSGAAIVVATGINTVIGGISKEISQIDSEMPLKKNIRFLSRVIIFSVALIGASIFFGGITSGKTSAEMFPVVISLAVSIIPEGLPVVITVVLAAGVWRMSKNNALIKKLQAVEALGQTSILAVDKTGTITKNEMMIRKIYGGEKMFDVGGIGYSSKGHIALEGSQDAIDPLNHPELLIAGKIAAYCANAKVVYSKEKKDWVASGDPTEAAIYVLAEKIGFNKKNLEKESFLISEIPFNFVNKYHATLHVEKGGDDFLTVVGAPEVVLKKSATFWFRGDHLYLDEKKRREFEKIIEDMSMQGLRVLAFATKEKPGRVLKENNIDSLSFAGFFGMKDALRLEAFSSIEEAAKAGIKTVMITGDHKVTARAIAKEAGIFKEGDIVLTGQEIDAMPEKDFLEAIGSTSVFARVTPHHKLKIVEAYKKRGEIVAMTGDGVNDAPSLVAADLGVGMGKIGTEVAKEAADIVLLDDNLSSIVRAIEEGRNIYKTIKKVILYLFSTSLGEVLTLGGALFFASPLPILPAQIIWLNFVTDGFLNVALALEPREKGLLVEKFKKPGRFIVDFLMIQRMFTMAAPMMLGTLILFPFYVSADMRKAWTVSLTVLAVFQWFNAWNCRSETESLFKSKFFANKYLVAATGIVIFLQLLAVYNPFMQKILRTAPLELKDWLIIVPVAASIILFEEIRKMLHRKMARI
ncbi:HAD family hydrolase [Candidatus Parcubacteria bacterium]|nr:MAG: HAD family hydrolase [Candidatus Parcubacteria bacterium]